MGVLQLLLELHLLMLIPVFGEIMGGRIEWLVFNARQKSDLNIFHIGSLFLKKILELIFKGTAIAFAVRQ
jgi:hypothetical protein